MQVIPKVPAIKIYKEKTIILDIDILCDLILR